MKIPHLNGLLWRAFAGGLLLGFGWHAPANPTGMTVQSGSASAAANGPRLTVTTSPLAVLNWHSFNIAAGETTIFNQPSAASIVVNRINDLNPSQIYGSLQANGMVVLMNASGFYFGPNAFIKTGGLIVSTANCLPPQNSGGAWEFNGPPPLASIVNYGQIQIGNGGSAFLIADNVENHGSISAPGGAVGLASGQTVLLSDRPDGRGMSMEVTLPQGSVNNYGTIVADGGTIAMNARVVNQNGFLQANSVQNVGGVIELAAADQLNLGAHSQILAQGDDSAGGSSGGSVALKADNSFSDDVGGKIDVSGGAQGGNGGNVEISAPNILSLNSTVDAGAQTGWRAGVFALDPIDMVLGTVTSHPPNNDGTIDGTSGSGVFYVDVNHAFQNINAGQILLKASGNIYIGDGTVNPGGSFTPAAGVAWYLTGSAGNRSSGQLTLEAGNNITFENGSSISDANHWSIALYAGVTDFTPATPKVQPGRGSISFFDEFDPNDPGNPIVNPSGFLQTASGSITLVAGQNIALGSASVTTTGGGSISAHALAGNIDTGNYAQGYHFLTDGSASSLNQAYDLSGGLGGISTAGGGNVTLIAGGSVSSVLPLNGNSFLYDSQILPANNDDYLTAGSGAYGRQAGDVTIVAGGDVTGHYLVANGTGRIHAGVQMDANGNPVTDPAGNYALGATGSAGGLDASNPRLALSLVNGGWNVSAAQNILLQEVRNPNGVFDVNASPAYRHYFDYAPGDYVNLSANFIQLGDAFATLPRNDNAIRIPVIYPSILNIAAGAGGVTLGAPSGAANSLILFPSKQGSLTINTTDGGPLIGSLDTVQGGVPQLFNLIVSDSSSRRYTSSASFGANDHAATPVHADSPTPIVLNISGDMRLVNLVCPEAAQINVGGNMINCGFQGMNLFAGDVTSINVTGDIYNRSRFTGLSGVTPAEAAQLLVYLSRSVDPVIPAGTLISSFYYNPATQTLTYQDIKGKTLAAVLNVLNSLPVQQYLNGVPQWANPPSAGGDPPYNTIPKLDPNVADANGRPGHISILGNPNTAGTVASRLLARYNNPIDGGGLGGPPPSTLNGFVLGGGGEFDVTARSIDLGTSAGIVSKGVGLYILGASYPLARLFGAGGVFDHGADISVTTTGNHAEGTTDTGESVGDLNMYSSSIASLNGGSISIHAGGDVNAGSAVLTVNSLGVRGIYSTSGGNLSVIANNDVNVNGSRIATYDGGNVTVESLSGNVNAGTGASLPVSVLGYYEDSATHKVYFTNPQIPFSGILALTLLARDAAYPAPNAILGNILVEAFNGNVNANVSGILQIPLNHLTYPDATTTVLAGYELRDASGQLPLSAAEIAPGDTFHVPAGNNPPYAADLVDSQGNVVGELVLGANGKDINAIGSGVIASNAKLEASGSINGLIFARNNIDINAQQNINVTALGLGNVNVSSAAGTISGTLIGVGGVSASGGSIDASLVSANVTGATSGQSGLGQGTAANATAQAASSADASQTAASSDPGNEDDQKKKKEIALAQKVSRVTVILPARSSPPDSSRNQTSTQPL